MARAWSWVVLLVAVVAGGWLGELASACTADNCSVWGTWTDKTSATDTEHWWYSLTEEGPCAFKGNTLNGTPANVDGMTSLKKYKKVAPEQSTCTEFCYSTGASDVGTLSCTSIVTYGVDLDKECYEGCRMIRTGF